MCSELLWSWKNMQIEKLKESTCRYIALKPHLSSHTSVTLVWPTTLHEHFFWLTLLNSTPKEYVASLRTSSAANLGNAIQSLGRLDLVIKLLAGSWTTHKRMLVLNRSWEFLGYRWLFNLKGVVLPLPTANVNCQGKMVRLQLHLEQILPLLQQWGS